MPMSDDELLAILRHQEAKLQYAENSRIGFLTGEMIALAGMREVERRCSMNVPAYDDKI